MRRELDSLVTQMHSSGIRYEEAVREFKRQYLREVLVAHRGNQCKAAEELGMHRNTLSRAMAELGLELAEVRTGLKRPPRSERPVFSAFRQGYRRPGLTAHAPVKHADILQPSQEARVAIEPGFAWDGQDAYLFDIDGTLLRSRDRIHFNSFASSVQRVTGFEITLAGILLARQHRYSHSARGLPTGRHSRRSAWNSVRRPFWKRCAMPLPNNATRWT